MPRQAPRLPPEVSLEIKQGFFAGDEGKRAVFAKYTAMPWGWSRSKIYDIAKAEGWESGRKTRSDKGLIRVPGITEELIELGAKLQIEATRHKTDFPPPRSTKLLASTGLDGNFGFHKGGYIATCNKLNISSCSGVGVLF
jgi:hypothetical protein